MLPPSMGLDSILLPAPYSAMASILLAGGLFVLGRWVAKLFYISSDDPERWEFYVTPLLGAMVLVIVLHPLVLFGVLNAQGLRLVAIMLGILGAIELASVARRLAGARFDFHSLASLKALPWWLVGGLGVVALSPMTNADSLDYHLGVPLFLIQNGHWPVSPEWFHSRLAGAGETLIALGLSIGAEQFSSLLQWIGVFTLTGLLAKYEEGDARLRAKLALAAATAPVMLAVVSSAKPQLLPAAMVCAALALELYPSRRTLTGAPALRGFAGGCLLLAVATQMKFSFLLSAGVVGFVAIFAMRRVRLFSLALPVALFIAVMVVAPVAIWKHMHFGGGLLEAIIVPFPGTWPAYDNFEHFLRGYRESSLPFPISFVVPEKLGLLTTVLGIGVVALVWLKPEKRWYWWGAVIAAMTVLVLGFMLGQVNARFYVEPFVWLLMAVAMQSPRAAYPGSRLVSGVLLTQAGVFVGLLVFSILFLSYGALGPSWREQVMIRNANGYALMKWADQSLPKDAVIISTHRSVALAPRPFVSADWVPFAENVPNDQNPYLSLLKGSGVTHGVIAGDYRKSPFAACFDTIVAGPFRGFQAKRNPMNQGEPYEGWVMRFDVKKLPECFRPSVSAD